MISSVFHVQARKKCNARILDQLAPRVSLTSSYMKNDVAILGATLTTRRLSLSRASIIRKRLTQVRPQPSVQSADAF